MPIYEYQCNACGEHHEALQKVSDAPVTECPHCHAAELKRIVSAAGFRLKGTGWYATDFKDKGKKPAAAKENTSDNKTKKPEKKSETKE